MYSNKTGKKLNRPILKYGQLEWHWDEKDSFIDFELFVFLHTLIFDDIYGWFSNFYIQKNLHFLQPVISKIIPIGNFKDQFPKIILERETAYGLSHRWSYFKKQKEYELDFDVKLKLKVCSLYDTKISIYPLPPKMDFFLGFAIHLFISSCIAFFSHKLVLQMYLCYRRVNAWQQ